MTIEAIVGSMYSGKSEEVIRRIHRYEIAGLTLGKEILCFTFYADDRYGENLIASHSGGKIAAIPLRHSREILAHLTDEVEVVVIDEAQFFDEELPGLLLAMDRGLHLEMIVAGLDTNFRGEPYGPMGQIMAIAKRGIARLTAVCTFVGAEGKKCGREAVQTQRIKYGQPADYKDQEFVVGGKEAYEARCAEHHIVPGVPRLADFRPKLGA